MTFVIPVPLVGGAGGIVLIVFAFLLAFMGIFIVIYVWRTILSLLPLVGH